MSARTEAIERSGSQPLEVARAQRRLGLVRQAQGDFPEAESTMRQALRGMRRTIGNEHTETAGVYLDLAWLLREQHDALGLDGRTMATGIARYGQSLRRNAHPADHLAVAEADYMLALAYSGTGRGYVDAELRLRGALPVYEAQLGPDHPRTADVQWLYGSVLVEGHSVSGTGMGNRLGAAMQLPPEPSPAAIARPVLENALRVRRHCYPEGHPKIALAESILGACLIALGEYDRGSALVRDAHAIIERTYPPAHHAVRTSEGRLALVDLVRGAPADAEARLSALGDREGRRRPLVIIDDDGDRESALGIDYVDDFGVKTLMLDVPLNEIASAHLWLLGRPFNWAGGEFSERSTHRIVVNTGFGADGGPRHTIHFNPALIFGYRPDTWHWTSLEVPVSALRPGANTFEITEQGSDSSWEQDNLYLGIDVTSDHDRSAWYSNEQAPRSPEMCTGELMIRLQIMTRAGSRVVPAEDDLDDIGGVRMSTRGQLMIAFDCIARSMIIEDRHHVAADLMEVVTRHYDVPRHRNDLGACQIHTAPLAVAEATLTRSLEGLVERYGANHRSTWLGYDRLVELYEHHGDHGRADVVRQQIKDKLVSGYEYDRDRFGPLSDGAQSYIEPLAHLCRAMGDEAEAERWLARRAPR